MQTPPLLGNIMSDASLFSQAIWLVGPNCCAYYFDGISGIVNKPLLVIINMINSIGIFIYSGPPEEY
jgi:hypothetical protein